MVSLAKLTSVRTDSGDITGPWHGESIGSLASRCVDAFGFHLIASGLGWAVYGSTDTGERIEFHAV